MSHTEGHVPSVKEVVDNAQDTTAERETMPERENQNKKSHLEEHHQHPVENEGNTEAQVPAGSKHGVRTENASSKGENASGNEPLLQKGKEKDGKTLVGVLQKSLSLTPKKAHTDASVQASSQKPHSSLEVERKTSDGPNAATDNISNVDDKENVSIEKDREQSDKPLTGLRRRFTQLVQKDEAADKKSRSSKDESDRKETSPQPADVANDSEKNKEHQTRDQNGTEELKKDEDANVPSPSSGTSPLIKRVRSIATNFRHLLDADKDKDHKREETRNESTASPDDTQDASTPAHHASATTHLPATETNTSEIATPSYQPRPPLATRRLSLAAVGAEAKHLLFGHKDESRRSKSSYNVATTEETAQPSKPTENVTEERDSIIVPVLDRVPTKKPLDQDQTEEVSTNTPSKKATSDWKVAMKRAFSTPLHLTVPSSGEKEASDKKKEARATEAHLEEGDRTADPAFSNSKQVSSPPRSPIRSPTQLLDHLKGKINKVGGDSKGEESCPPLGTKSAERIAAHPGTSLESAINDSPASHSEREQPLTETCDDAADTRTSATKKETKSSHRHSIFASIKRTLHSAPPQKNSITQHELVAPFQAVDSSVSTPVTLAPEPIPNPAEHISADAPPAPASKGAANVTDDNGVEEKKEIENKDCTKPLNAAEEMDTALSPQTSAPKESTTAEENDGDDALLYADLPPTPTPKPKHSSRTILSGHSIAVTAREE